MAKAQPQWSKAILPLIKKYKGKKHPLEYKNNHQLMMMVLLSARSSDAYINKIAPGFFAAYPDLKALQKAAPEKILPLIKGVPGGAKKISWMIAIAKELKGAKDIPLTMDELVVLPGIGRKSANVIMREAGVSAAGVMVDLHVVRVAQRLGIAKSSDPKIIEEEIMRRVKEKDWGEAGMAMTFLGREICRPRPLCPECLMRPVCEFYQKGGYDKLLKEEKKKGKKIAAPVKPPKK